MLSVYCKNCSCKKANRECSNCLPHRRGHCTNAPSLQSNSAITSSDKSNSAQSQNTQTQAVTTEPTEPAFPTSLAENLSSFPQDVTPLDMLQNTSTTSPDEDSNQSHPLPSFTEIPTPNFRWGEKDGEYLTQKIDQCYKEVVHWRRNLVKVPSGKVGTSFVQEVTHMFRAYAESSALEGIAMKAAMILPALLLQKPHSRSRTKEHVKHLERRIGLWKDGNLDSLLDEGKTIQSRLSREGNSRNVPTDQISRNFSQN